MNLIQATGTYERLKPSGPITLFSMKMLARGPIAACAHEAKHRASKAKKERIYQIEAVKRTSENSPLDRRSLYMHCILQLFGVQTRDALLSRMAKKNHNS